MSNNIAVVEQINILDHGNQKLLGVGVSGRSDNHNALGLDGNTPINIMRKLSLKLSIMKEILKIIPRFTITCF